LGGTGSGRYERYGAKRTTSSYDTLDVRWLSRKGLLRSGVAATITFSRNNVVRSSVGFSTDSDGSRVTYRSANKATEPYNVDQRISLSSTACHLGGERNWFSCPKCFRRVAILYCGRIVGCRTCLNLSYQSQNESGLDRMLRKGQKLNQALGSDTWFLKSGTERRPKGMHRRTYKRKSAEVDRIRHRALGGFSRYADNLNANLAKNTR
jgi:hypothetical protein